MAEQSNQKDKSIDEEVVVEQTSSAEADASTNEEQSGDSAEQGAEVSPEELVAGLQEEVEKARDEALRTQAEMQNLRRRVERDVENAHKFALEKFVNELLPVVDNLERAIAAIDKENRGMDAVSEGVELTLKSFLDVLKRFNVETIDPKDAAFDPELHQAMSAIPTAEVPPNTVMEVFQKGYTLNSRLVRPAMVVVSKAVAS